jgi:hypothetical protein
MQKRKSKAPYIFIVILMLFAILAGAVALYYFNGEIELYENRSSEARAFFQTRPVRNFTNSAADADPYIYIDPRDDALYLFETHEGFTMVSHSEAWDEDMLIRLYHELLLNTHGDEISYLYEVIVYPHDEEDGHALATFARGVTVIDFIIQFPALPEDFKVPFPQDTGTINLFGGDTNTTIESMANSLSHEYGHLYTFYYMLGIGGNVDDSNDTDSLSDTMYATLRDAARFDLIMSLSPGENYLQERHRYLIEIAAEDYVQLMGSPTTRQVVDFIDVRQVVNGAERPTSIRGARNAFPQENLMIPLANEVPGLKEYFFSFINSEPRVPLQEKKDITLQIRKNDIGFNLMSGYRTFTHFVISWNTPYEYAIYTLVCYDPYNYTGWGIPIKTVRPGQTASAIVGEYVVERGNQVESLDDGLADGTKVFLVIAMLPDGTFYLSEKMEHTFN